VNPPTHPRIAVIGLGYVGLPRSHRRIEPRRVGERGGDGLRYTSDLEALRDCNGWGSLRSSGSRGRYLIGLLIPSSRSARFMIAVAVGPRTADQTSRHSGPGLPDVILQSNISDESTVSSGG